MHDRRHRWLPAEVIRTCHAPVVCIQTVWPAAFAAAASRAAAGRHASILSAHTAEEIIFVVSVAAATGPQAVAMALAVVADALSAGDPQLSPSR